MKINSFVPENAYNSNENAKSCIMSDNPPLIYEIRHTNYCIWTPIQIEW